MVFHFLALMMVRPLTLIRSLPLLLSFILIESSGENETSVSAYCNESTCGGIKVKYPFWLVNDVPKNAVQYCGYKGFRLHCSSPSTPEQQLILHLGDDNFYVKSINYTTSTISLIDIGVITNKICPIPRHNLTLEDLPLGYSRLADWNLKFYFNCIDPPPPPPDNIQIHRLDCLRSVEKTSYVTLDTNQQHDEETDQHDFFKWFEICEEKVVAPHVVKAERFNELISNWVNILAGAMSEGFVLNWRAESESCMRCESSEGRCGFNNTSNKPLCFCHDGSIHPDRCNIEGQRNLGPKIGIAVGGALLTAVIICIMYFVYHSRSFMSILRMKTKEDKNLEAFIRKCGSLAPKRYSYSDVRKITNSFKEEIGQGGYGTVYKGKLSNGRLVAVKKLKISEENAEEFISEVLSISKTSHVNIVMLLGFCIEGKRRALVYDYMPNGSLEKYVHGLENSQSCNQLGMDKLFQISLGVARGLDYLHQRCNTRILHFDIKPHNILLDKDFCPKISDFGLAKQYSKKESIVSILGARGTIGYIAPELVSRSFGAVSYKSDVYSYGMMILEIAGRRKNVNAGVSHTSEIYFPHWAYRHLIVHQDMKLKGAVTSEEDEIASKIILVGLWCIQHDPSQRPTMSKVIEMLEGSLKAIEIPPKAFFGFPTTPQASSNATVLAS